MESFEKNIRGLNTQLSFRGLSAENLGPLARTTFERIAIFGMGGSGLPGMLLDSVKNDAGVNVPITIWRNYGLPQISFARTLSIFVSFSGNTEETLSGLKLLLKKGVGSGRIAVVTTGGELKAIAERRKLPLVTFDAGILTPRQALGKMFYSLIKILKAARLGSSVKEFTNIVATRDRLKARRLAKYLKDRVVLIYTHEPYQTLGYIWKIICNETAKILAFTNTIPELDHNEITGFETLKVPIAAIFLKDTNNKRLAKKFKLTEQLLKTRRVKCFTFTFDGRSRLEKIWRMVLFAEWTAYFLAKLNHIDPEETEIIEKLKKLMK